MAGKNYVAIALSALYSDIMWKAKTISNQERTTL